MKYLIYVDCLERVDFFKRVTNSLDGTVLFLTNRLSIVFALKDFEVKMIKNQNYDERLGDDELAQTLSIAGKYQDLNQARILSSSVFAAFDLIFDEYNFDRLLLWNGSTTIAKSLAKCAQNKNLKTTFFELSNLPSKLFWDHCGVNAASSLYQNPQILDGYIVDEDVWQNWKNFYISQKSVVKQSSNKHKIRYLQILDYLGFFAGLAKEDFRNPFEVVTKKFKNKFSKNFEICDLESEFVFVPLQVSNDTQIILNSDFDNFDAINFAKQKYPQKQIYIKIHPAEENQEFISKIEKLASKLECKICSNETKELINKASNIVVINSTVGLEAMILGKNIDILGRAVYAKFDEIRLKNYICAHLANIEYFDNSPINYKEMQRVLG